MLRIKAAEGISENDRERDTFKYDPTLIDGVAFNDTSKPLNSSQLFTANDTVLTSLAQLGAIRTRTSRSLISLFDQHWQYIIAEATPNLPLLPNISQAELEGEHLWLSRTAIPRVHGVCKHTLVDPGSIDDPEDELPLTVTNDLTMDSRFCKKPYCMPGSSARFYAAVPIRTPGGINIGVYCVIDETPKPISSWTGKHTAVLRHISRAIMSHIDFRSTKNTQRVNERMTRGIASFMEADFDTATLHPLVDPNLAGYQRKVVLPLNSSQLDLPGYPVVEVDQPILHVQSHLLTQRTNASFQGLSALERSEQQTPDNRPGLNRSSRSYTSNSSSSSSEQSTDLNSSTITKCIFNTAANIVRESIECDGMFFFNANAVGLDVPFEPLQRFPASSDGSTVNADAEDNDIDCPTLGSSMSSLSSSTTDAVSTHDIKMPAKLLSTLFRRYPTGNIFVFDEYGTIQNNEPLGDSDSSMLPIPPATDTKPQPARQFSNSRSRSIVAEVLSKCFPGARSVVFAPVRDDLKERWFAGGFAYTTKPTRVFTIPGELSYARAFSTLIMAEVHRMEITLAHRAKSDILNSLSHELRSPLHGVILSTELLADTALDVYQGNILHTLETCGRTLLDTVDHLLDYSKINNFLKSAKAEKRAARGRRSQVATPIEAGMKNLYSNVCLDVLVEEVVESVFAGHQFQHMSVAQLTRRHSLHADTGANRHADSARGIEDLGLSLNDKGELQLLLDRVSVYLDIDANVSSFQFSSMAGALRRVIMNLFGNALQYTNDGKIHIALSIDPETNESTRDDYRVTRLTIMDTGRGMSADFIQNDLYRPFRQADQLSAGIGLGLSLVKKIVSSLKGKISITSQLGVGTVVTVLLPLPFVSIPCTVDPVEQHECREIDDHRSKLKGLRVRLAGFKANDAAAASMLGCHQRAGLEFSIDKICREWLQMETLTQSCSNYLAPDVIICPEASLDELCQGQELSSIPPVVAICTNAIVARDRSLNTGGAYRQRIYEFISQPVGPTKLARVLSHAVRRWADQQSFPPSPENTPSMSNIGHDSELINSGCVPSTSCDISSRTPPFEQPNPLDTLSNVPNATKPAQTLELDRSQSQSSSLPLPVTLTPPTPPISSFPVQQSLPLRHAEKPFTRSPLKLGTTSSTSQASTKFLLVDDNPINLQILCVYMKKLGHSYATAVDGQDAVDRYKAQPGCFKYIFMDISMPRLDGMEATRQIRAFEREQHLDRATVYALSGLASASVQEEASNSGIDLFLTKPVRLKELNLILADRVGSPRQ